MTWDFEIDEDGYPTDECIARLARHKFGPPEAAQFMVEQFPAVCEQIPCCSCTVEDGVDEYFGKPEKIIHFSTGGWSGAETLINTVLGHFWIKQLQWQWRRGGHYIFKVRQDCAAKVSETDTLGE